MSAFDFNDYLKFKKKVARGVRLPESMVSPQSTKYANHKYKNNKLKSMCKRFLNNYESR